MLCIVCVSFSANEDLCKTRANQLSCFKLSFSEGWTYQPKVNISKYIFWDTINRKAPNNTRNDDVNWALESNVPTVQQTMQKKYLL